MTGYLRLLCEQASSFFISSFLFYWSIGSTLLSIGPRPTLCTRVRVKSLDSRVMTSIRHGRAFSRIFLLICHFGLVCVTVPCLFQLSTLFSCPCVACLTYAMCSDVPLESHSNALRDGLTFWRVMGQTDSHSLRLETGDKLWEDVSLGG